MSQARIYSFDDPDFPEELQTIKRIFFTPKFGEPPPGTGYQKFMDAKQKLKKKTAEKRAAEQQTSLVTIDEIEQPRRVFYG